MKIYQAFLDSVQSRNTQRLLALLAGCIYSVAFIVANAWVAAIIGLAIWYMTLYYEPKVLERWLRGFMFGIGKFFIAGFWVFVTLLEHSSTPFYASLMLFGGIVVVLALCFGGVAMCAMKTRFRLVDAAMFASVVCLFEIAISFPIGFSSPYFHVGYAFVGTPLDVFAPLGGVWLVSYMAVFIAVSIVFLFHKTYSTLVIVVLVIATTFITERLFAPPSTGSEEFKVALVRVNTSPDEKFRASSLEERWQGYVEYSKKAAPADLIVWPESSIPSSLEIVRPRIYALAQQLDSNFLVGAFDTRGLRTYNAAVLIGDRTSIYHKQQLAPVGEYTADLWLLKPLLEQFEFPQSEISVGTRSSALLTTDGFSIKIAICYEIAYPQLIRRRLAETDFIVTISEDAWYSGTAGPFQQQQVSQMRARETGRTVLRVSNGGYTSVIRPDGTVQANLGLEQSGVLEAHIRGGSGNTLFTRFHLIPIIGLIVLSLVAGVVFVQRSDATKPQPPKPN